MMQRCAAGLPVLAGILAGVWVGPAFAADPPCADVTVEATGAVTTRWPRLLTEVREAFEARDDIDRCARVALTAHDAFVTVEVVLPDGRAAVRLVPRRQDVVPTLEALLLLPQRTAQVEPLAALDTPPASPPASSASAPREVPPPGPPVLPFVRVDRDSAPAPEERRARLLGIELSVLTDARIGDGQSAVGLGALSFLDVSGWLVGLEGRVDRYEPLPAGPMDGAALELAVLGGRRVPFDNVALDLSVGGALAMEGTRSYASESPAGAGGVSGPSSKSSSTVPRLLLGARMDFGARSIVRTFAGIDGELSSPRALGPDVPGTARLPLWTLGIALGARVGTR